MSLPPRMRAVVFERTGTFGVDTVPTPRPARNEALVRVRSSMICGTDEKILAGKFPATRFPHVPGHEFSGDVVAIGEGVTLAPGARVGVEVHVGCGTCDRCREGMYTLCLNYGKRETGHAHVGFTTSGNSPNMVRAFEAAKKLKIITCGMLGRDGGKCKSPSRRTGCAPKARPTLSTSQHPSA